VVLANRADVLFAFSKGSSIVEKLSAGEERSELMAIVKVVKYNGTPDVFAWKYPDEELGTWTQLIVNESQEAVLFKGGQALDLFGSGRHTLETKNIPILSKLVNLPFGGSSPFTAEVWYINKIHSLDIKWGTPTPIQIQDPKYDIFIPVSSFGQFGITITDSKKFLTKLVGTLPLFNKDNIIKYFRGVYITKVKDGISSYLLKKQISVVEINAYIDELSSFMKKRIEAAMDEYGIKLLNFFINDISVPEDDPAVKQLKEALSKKAEMNIVGFNYQQERSFDTMETAAGNTSSDSAQFMGAGMGLGMGVGLGGAMGSQFGGIAQNINTSVSEQKECPNCHKMIDKNNRFCGECGADTTANIDGIICSGCNAKVPKGTKFCPECGTRLSKTCPKCNTELNGNAKFCLECGEKIK
jgi:membrane protease subunit (stomatin/prohibitin family)